MTSKETTIQNVLTMVSQPDQVPTMDCEEKSTLHVSSPEQPSFIPSSMKSEHNKKAINAQSSGNTHMMEHHQCDNTQNQQSIILETQPGTNARVAELNHIKCKWEQNYKNKCKWIHSEETSDSVCDGVRSHD